MVLFCAEAGLKGFFDWKRLFLGIELAFSPMNSSASSY